MTIRFALVAMNCNKLQHPSEQKAKSTNMIDQKNLKVFDVNMWEKLSHDQDTPCITRETLRFPGQI